MLSDGHPEIKDSGDAGLQCGRAPYTPLLRGGTGRLCGFSGAAQGMVTLEFDCAASQRAGAFGVPPEGASEYIDHPRFTVSVSA